MMVNGSARSELGISVNDATEATGTLPQPGATVMDQASLFRMAIEFRIETARKIDAVAALFDAVFELWDASGDMVRAAWPDDCQLAPSDVAVLRDPRFGAWALPERVQSLIEQGGANCIGTLQDRELRAWAQYLK